MQFCCRPLPCSSTLISLLALCHSFSTLVCLPSFSSLHHSSPSSPLASFSLFRRHQLLIIRTSSTCMSPPALFVLLHCSFVVYLYYFSLKVVRRWRRKGSCAKGHRYYTKMSGVLMHVRRVTNFYGNKRFLFIFYIFYYYYIYK